MSFRGVTFNNQLCKSEDDALIYDTFLNHVVGKVKGCSITFDESTIRMAVGFFVAYGRLIHVDGEEVLTPEPIEIGEQYNKLVFTINLEKENTIQEFNQGYFEFLKSYEEWPELMQEDLFEGGLVYQIPIAEFILTKDGITEYKEKMQSVNVEEVWQTLDENLTTFREYFEEFFEVQKKIIEQMIEDLEGEDFVTHAELENITYDGNVTTFEEDGSITTVYESGKTERTMFEEDGSILKETTSGGYTIQEITTFEEDGTIKVRVEKEA